MTTWREPKRRPYAMARRGVWEDARVGKSALRVYLEMESAASKDRLCWLSVDTIAERLSMDASAVQKARKDLKDFGKIEFVHFRTMPGRGLSVAVYRMLGDPTAPDDLAVSGRNPPPTIWVAAPAKSARRPRKIDLPPPQNPPPNQESLEERTEEREEEGCAPSAPSNAPRISTFRLGDFAGHCGLSLVGAQQVAAAWQAQLEGRGFSPSDAVAVIENAMRAAPRNGFMADNVAAAVAAAVAKTGQAA